MSSNPFKPQRGSELIMEHLKQQILSGEYPPGSRLPTVVELSASFQVGRSTIREALSALKAIGYINIRHGGGTFVNQTLPAEEDNNSISFSVPMESLREVIEVRKYIETGCASLAALRRTPSDLEAISATLDLMQRALGDEAESEKADVQFHLQIARASHNTLLIDLMESLNERLQENMRESRRLWFYSERAAAERLLKEHRLIFEAIQAQNEALAAQTMMQHLTKVESVMKSFV